MEGLERELHLRIEGEVYRQVVRCEETYVSAVGLAQVLRSLYGSGKSGERTVSTGAPGGDSGRALDALGDARL
ncbi:MAG: hypothetical protein ACREYE_01740 [Gammaproteobacteria bacterium]